MTVLELLSDPKRWTRGRNRRCDESGRLSYCILGALAKCYKTCAAYSAAKWEVERNLPPGSYSIPSFNDDPSTTHADILEVLTKAGV